MGTLSLKAGSEITIVKVDPDGVLITRGESTPVKVAREVITIDSLAVAESSPVPTPTPVPTPSPRLTPVAKSISSYDSSSVSKNNISTSNFDSLVGIWTNIKSSSFQGAPNYKIEIQSLSNIIITQEFSMPDGTKNVNSSKWHALEQSGKIIFERNQNISYSYRSNYKQWYEIRLPFNLYKLEVVNCYKNSDGNSGTQNTYYKRQDN